MMNDSKRLDLVLVERNFFDSRSKAQAAVMAGEVSVNGQIVPKCSCLVKIDDEIAVLDQTSKYVGRGGEKLEAAIKEFKVNVKDKIAIDIGASTGGFSQCLIRYGAKLVFAVDAGQNQLSPILKTEPKIINLEKVNARYLTLKRYKNILEENGYSNDIINLTDIINFAVVDVSFISILKVMPSIISLLIPGSEIISLIKPQFEAGKNDVGKGGIIKDKKLVGRIIDNTKTALVELGLVVIGIMPSPVLGAKGNQEYLFYLKKKAAA